VLGGDLIPAPTGSLLALVVVAAFAEEIFFRRFVYGALARYGVGVAIAVSSIAFALVHVTLWGWRAVPVDLAAGALFGWQRWTTASWTAAGVTHAAANVLMLL
jgi:membrane protease YdiL (CAAX protease family)